MSRPLPPYTGEVVGIRPVREGGLVQLDATMILAAVARGLDGQARTRVRWVVRKPDEVVAEVLEREPTEQRARYVAWCRFCGDADLPSVVEPKPAECCGKDQRVSDLPAGWSWAGRVRWTLDRAKESGAIEEADAKGKALWKNHPESMLRNRVAWEVWKVYAPDALPVGARPLYPDEEDEEQHRPENPAHQGRPSIESRLVRVSTDETRSTWGPWEPLVSYPPDAARAALAGREPPRAPYDGKTRGGKRPLFVEVFSGEDAIDVYQGDHERSGWDVKIIDHRRGKPETMESVYDRLRVLAGNGQRAGEDAHPSGAVPEGSNNARAENALPTRGTDAKGADGAAESPAPAHTTRAEEPGPAGASPAEPGSSPAPPLAPEHAREGIDATPLSSGATPGPGTDADPGPSAPAGEPQAAGGAPPAQRWAPKVHTLTPDEECPEPCALCGEEVGQGDRFQESADSLDVAHHLCVKDVAAGRDPRAEADDLAEPVDLEDRIDAALAEADREADAEGVDAMEAIEAQERHEPDGLVEEVMDVLGQIEETSKAANAKLTGLLEKLEAPRGGDLKISDEVRAVLERADVTDTLVRLPGERLERGLYVAVNKVLEAAGGKWDRRAQAHVFTRDPRQALGLALESGSIVDRKKAYQAFYTPPALAARVVELAELDDGQEVLEPSAGGGALVDAVLAKVPGAKLQLVELDDEAVAALRTKPSIVAAAGEVSLRHGDFLATDWPARFDRVVMNPPFTKRQDIAHVLHAFRALKPGGVLVSIVSGGALSGSTKANLELRELVERHGETWPVEAGAFSESGTEVATTIIRLRAPAAAPEADAWGESSPQAKEREERLAREAARSAPAAPSESEKGQRHKWKAGRCTKCGRGPQRGNEKVGPCPGGAAAKVAAEVLGQRPAAAPAGGAP